ncbi:hypothetical protein K438DRAFT_1758836 [Mycena galopus ATCC 62051]|nr:hypothetical protein K438DRAFT_1758836 [Mycena galopus ATCC 62051]
MEEFPPRDGYPSPSQSFSALITACSSGARHAPAAASVQRVPLHDHPLEEGEMWGRSRNGTGALDARQQLRAARREDGRSWPSCEKGFSGFRENGEGGVRSEGEGEGEPEGHDALQARVRGSRAVVEARLEGNGPYERPRMRRASPRLPEGNGSSTTDRRATQLRTLLLRARRTSDSGPNSKTRIICAWEASQADNIYAGRAGKPSTRTQTRKGSLCSVRESAMGNKIIEARRSHVAARVPGASGASAAQRVSGESELSVRCQHGADSAEVKLDDASCPIRGQRNLYTARRQYDAHGVLPTFTADESMVKQIILSSFSGTTSKLAQNHFALKGPQAASCNQVVRFSDPKATPGARKLLHLLLHLSLARRTYSGTKTSLSGLQISSSDAETDSVEKTRRLLRHSTTWIYGPGTYLPFYWLTPFVEGPSGMISIIRASNFITLLRCSGPRLPGYFHPVHSSEWLDHRAYDFKSEIPLQQDFSCFDCVRAVLARKRSGFYPSEARPLKDTTALDIDWDIF